MKRIALTQGKFALVDDEDFERLNQFKWYANKSRQVWYARRAIYVNGKQIMLRMHQEIIGKRQGFIADHKDGDGLNNQRTNLRHVTRRQNCQNLHNRSRSSKYPGVYWQRINKKWMARIWIDDKIKYLGLFIDESKAFEAYRQAVNATGETVIGEIN